MDSQPCDRCSYDAADPELDVPELFADRYSAVCEHCYHHLIKQQAKFSD